MNKILSKNVGYLYIILLGFANKAYKLLIYLVLYKHVSSLYLHMKKYTLVKLVKLNFLSRV